MRKILLAFCLVVGGCTAAQTTTATQDIQQAFTVLASACADAQIALATAQGTVKGGALSTVNSIGGYIQQGCGTAASAQKLASDPTSLQWLGQMIGVLNTLAPASAPATGA